ncbi:MAG TPA: hypothetical protein PKH54_03775 [Myxococcota bacterium]|nr:hypothetical protein [Myxococcota bacterium]
MTDSQSDKLQERVWQAIEFSADPGALAQAMHEFMPQCTFGVSDKVQTACISRSADGSMKLEFGRDFLDRELADDRDFLFVLMHEIYHHVLGHLFPSRKDRVSRIYRNMANVAADIMVNRAVCQRFFPDGVPLLNRMYRTDRLPEALLRPPDFDMEAVRYHQVYREQMIAQFKRGLARMGADKRLAGKVWLLCRAAWCKNAPYGFILERLMAIFSDTDALRLPRFVLIGSHQGEFGGLGDIIGIGDGGKGAGYSEDVETGETQVQKAAVNYGVAAALRRALEANSNRWQLNDPVACPGVVCVPGRRDAAMLAAGSYPVFYSANKASLEPEQLAHVYVDVSGSMQDEMPYMFGVLSMSRELIADPIHEFSNMIEDVSLHDFSRGVCRTTGGTDFDVIMKHAMDRSFRQVIIFTDGWASHCESVYERFKAAGKKLHLVFVNSSSESRNECTLTPIATSIFVMS